MPRVARGRNRVWRDWIVLALALVALSATGYVTQWAWRVDLTIYDAALVLWQRSAPDDIVIVAIDDASLASVGRWPWPRRTQALLLERIAAGKPKAVALDIIYTEADADSGADAALAAAIARNGRTVLATLADETRAARRYSPPVPALAAAAHSLGHVHVEIDPDAVVRSVYLLEGPARPDIAHLTLALLSASGEPVAALPGLVRTDLTPRSDSWQRNHWLRIPFSGPPGYFERISAAALLDGQIPPERLRDKLVLVGATAAGVGDGYAVPTSASSRLMPGVEISAQVLATLRERIDIRELSKPAGFVAAIVPVLCTLLGYLWLSPRASLPFTFAVAGVVAALTLLGLRAEQLWFPPAATLGTLALCYPLWSWRRLDASLAYMREDLRALQAEPDILPVAEPATTEVSTFPTDPIERTIDAVRTAATRVRGLRRFVVDSLERQADGALVTDLNGRIVLSNSRAAELIGTTTAALTGTSLASVLEQINVAGATLPAAPASGHAAGERVQQFEGRSRGERDLLVSIANCHGAGGGVIGYIVNLTDVSALKAASKAREDAMSFLSHDLRALQAAILTALELRRSAPGILPEDALLNQIEHSAQRTLSLAEAFVTLTRADHVEQRAFTPVDISDLVREMADEAWPLARAKATRVVQDIAHDDALVAGDRTLLGTAILNLLTNAINHTPGGTQVTIALRQRDHAWVVSIRDQGPGIPAEAQHALFQRYRRLGMGARHGSKGVGLGLVIVEAVARRHDGGVEVDSRPDAGSTFSIWLPALDADATQASPASH